MSDPVTTFSPEVEAALARLMPSSDAFDQPDFDPVEYLNKRFPDEASLDQIPAFLADVNEQLTKTEADLLDAVRLQATTAPAAARDLAEAQESVKSLHERVAGIKVKAEESEELVGRITENITQLDTAKRNLDTSIKTLKGIQLYILAIQNLEVAFEAKDFTRCHVALRAAHEHRDNFKEYNDIDKVKELADRLKALERQLEFHLKTFVIGDLRIDRADELGDDVLRDACFIVDALGSDVQQRIRQQFINTQLEPYATLFKRGTEDARLYRSDRRYAFVRQLLDTNERFFTFVFPKHWCVAQELCLEFCLRTHKEMTHQLHEEAGAIDVALLAYVLQRTIDVEKDLTSRMRWLQTEAEDEIEQQAKEAEAAGKQAPKTRMTIPEYKFYGMIAKAFDAHMDQYVQHEDQMLLKTLQQQVMNDTVVEDLLTLQSSQDLYLFIQESMRRAATFSQPHTMYELGSVWVKHLGGYVEALHRSVQSIPTSPEQEANACVVVNSADYCRSASEGLCSDLTTKAEGKEHEVAAAFESLQDNLAQLCSAATARVVDGLCQAMQQTLTEYQAHLSTLGGGDGQRHAEALDESAFVVQIRKTLKDRMMNCARNLHPHCYSYFLNKFAVAFNARIRNVVYKPLRGRLSEVAISQLRIDCSAIEKAILSTPHAILQQAGGNTAGASNAITAQKPPSRASVLGTAGASSTITLTAYTKTVRREFMKLTAALKVLQSEPSEQFAEVYYHSVAAEDRSLAHCAQLLELRGVKPDRMRQYLAVLKKHSDVPAGTQGGAALPSWASEQQTAARQPAPAAAAPTAAPSAADPAGAPAASPGPEGSPNKETGGGVGGAAAAIRQFKFKDLSLKDIGLKFGSDKK